MVGMGDGKEGVKENSILLLLRGDGHSHSESWPLARWALG